MKYSQLLGIGVGVVGLYILYPTISEWLAAMNPLSVLTNRRSAASLSQDNRPRGRYTTGLLNAGNFCFMNSDIQALASLPATYAYLSQIGYLFPPAAASLAPVSSSLLYFVRQLNQPVSTRTAISPDPLIEAIEQTYKTRMSRRQHDAHELLHLLLETLQQEHTALMRYAKEQGSLADAMPVFPFEGALVDEILCGNCHSSTERPTKYLVLSVTAPQKSSAALVDLLNDLTLPEFINDYGCTNCRVKRVMESTDPQWADLQRELAASETPFSAEIEDRLPKLYSPIKKTQRFDSAPQALCIHVSRSIYTGTFAARNSCKVDFPLELSLPGHVARYRLTAMIRHSGTHNIGHYECNRRKNTEFWENVNWSSLSEPAEAPEPELAQPAGPPEQVDAPLEAVAHETTSPAHTNEPGLPFPAKSEPSLSVSTEPAAAGQPHLQETVPKQPKSSKEWWAISDEEVRETTARAVLSLQSGAYILFYQQV